MLHTCWTCYMIQMLTILVTCMIRDAQTCSIFDHFIISLIPGLAQCFSRCAPVQLFDWLSILLCYLSDWKTKLLCLMCLLAKQIFLSVCLFTVISCSLKKIRILGLHQPQSVTIISHQSNIVHHHKNQVFLLTIITIACEILKPS